MPGRGAWEHAAVHADQPLPELLVTGRQRAGLTQEEAARRLRVSTTSIARWERGVAEPSATNLRKIAELYGITLGAPDVTTALEALSARVAALEEELAQLREDRRRSPDQA
jgi:transcriptional regulator with XRE-family HTH domain